MEKLLWKESIDEKNISWSVSNFPKDELCWILSLQENIGDMLFPKVPTVEEILNRYPDRPSNLPVTRYAPSPTGFMHIGNFYSAYISERIAHQQWGCFLLRIEDTDKKREVDSALPLIISTLKKYDLINDEGENQSWLEKGLYGPYRQSERGIIYKAFVKFLLSRWDAYVCFLTDTEIDEIRTFQEKNKLPIWIYGDFSKWRNATKQDVFKELQRGVPYVIRLKSTWLLGKKREIFDGVRGKMNIQENFLDSVILKQDGLPTYHFAHVVDDHLMKTTHVVRGDERIPSLPLHLQLFEILDRKPPQYIHIAPIMKAEEGKKRKISKRKDPEANMDYFSREWYPVEVLKEYLMWIMDSSYEGWKNQNPTKSVTEYEDFNYKKLNKSWALFDIKKLDSYWKKYFSQLSLNQFMILVQEWIKKYEPECYDKIFSDFTFPSQVFGIDLLDGKNLWRFSKISDIKKMFWFFDFWYEQKSKMVAEYVKNNKQKLILIDGFIDSLDMLNKDQWRNAFKFKCIEYWFEKELSSITRWLKMLLIGDEKGPDLYAILKVLGKTEVIKRLQMILLLAK